MALQELDLHIEYKPGKTNSHADTLSRYPVPLSPLDCANTETCALVAAVAVTKEDTLSETDHSRLDHDLSTRQRNDGSIRRIIDYLERGDLPQCEKEARELVLGKSQYTLLDNILYHIEPDHTLRVIPPTADRERLFKEAHEGPFSGHLREAKIHGQLSRHYWWPGMRRDIVTWCRMCITCATRSVGRRAQPPLTPIPVAGPFDRVGVDVLQLPKTKRGNRYAIVFVEYLTKWPEVYAAADQTAPTIAKLLVEEIISRHGVPRQLLSDRGPSFLSKLMYEVCQLLGVTKINTSAYHPQTDGLVERFNRTLTDMLSKSVVPGTQEWDVRLPYVLFAYRSTLQSSTRESPFFLLYGRDPQLPTQAALSPPVQREFVQLDDYRSLMVRAMSEAWDVAQKNIHKAQKRQKRQHDKGAKNFDFHVGDRVFVHMPSLKSGPGHKLARPFKGPYRILEVFPNGADVVLVDKPSSAVIRVALNRLRYCPTELSDKDSCKRGLNQVHSGDPDQTIENIHLNPCTSNDGNPGISTEEDEVGPTEAPITDSRPPNTNEECPQSAPTDRGDVEGDWGSRLRPRTGRSRTT